MKVSKAIKRLDQQIKKLHSEKLALEQLPSDDEVLVDFVMDEGGYTDPMMVLDFDYKVKLLDDVGENGEHVIRIEMEVNTGD